MSLILLNRLPVPNLRQYCTLSLVLLSTVILYAQKLLFNIANNEFIINNNDVDDNNQNQTFLNSTFIQENGYVYTIYKAITNEPWCLWVLINCCYCALLLFSKLVQKMIFGNLRVVEYQVLIYLKSLNERQFCYNATRVAIQIFFFGKLKYQFGLLIRIKNSKRLHKLKLLKFHFLILKFDYNR